MSGGGSGGGFRVPIPSSLRKTIQNIKEITGNHGDEEIYAMLKECGMDPNETADKLLHQDTFHEVKRKRDRKKENVSNNREHGESRWRPGGQGRGGRGGRWNFPPHHVSHDAGRGRITGPVKENGLQQGEEKGFVRLPISHGTREKERSSATSRIPSNSSFQIAPGSSSAIHISNIPSEGRPELDTYVSNSSVNEDIHEQPDKSLTVSPVPTPASTVCFSPSDPVVVPSNDSRVLSAVGTIKREVGAQHSSLEPNATVHVENKSSVGLKTGSSYPHGKTPNQSQGAGKAQLADFSQPSSTSSQLVSSISRPSSSYSNRSSHSLGGGQRGGSTMEWKPKAVQGSGTAGASDAPTTIEATTSSLTVSNLDSDDATSKLHKKLQELHLQQRQHVILPNHIHVPESERSKLSFGSFGTLLGVNTSAPVVPETEKSSTPMTETSQDIEENVEEDSSSNQNVLDTDEGDYSEEPQSPTHVTETQSCPDGDGDGDVDGNGSGVSSTINPSNYESKQDTGLPFVGHQHPMVQPIDQANYYAQFYHAGPDNDSRRSPGIAARYNGNVAQLPPSSQSLQEGGVFSVDGPAPLISQATGIMPSSMAVTQQPLPMFRPPAGINISHYPPNYIPYGHYLPPFYVPPLAIHQYLGNGSFPQQPQAGGMFPAPPTIGTVGVKYSLPQYKQGSNTGNSAHMGMATGYYGPYGSSVGGYNLNSGATAGNPTTNENLGQSQFKENNVYLAGQQTEGLAMWVAAPGRDISTLPPSSFYNLPPQAQHVSFAPAQAGHSTFAGLYHHPAHGVTTPTTVHPLLQQSQTMAGPVDMVGPGSGAYPKSQHGPINWPNNY